MSLSVNVKKRLGNFNLDVAFEVGEAAESVALLGASGCGKSMTLKCIAGIETPDEGRIVLNDRVLFDSEKHVNLRPQQRHVGYLFQNYALFPNMTVEQNIACGILDGTKAERASRVAEQVATFRLEGLEGKRPAQLSGGQQQRVALARIMASKPELLLLDEPFSALDGYLRWQLELELTDILREFPGGSVYVSHNRDEVYRMCDTVCVVSGGKSEQKVSVSELFAAPTTLAAALISGCKNVSRVTVGSDGVLDCADWGVRLRTSLPVPAGCTHVGIRAHYFEVGAETGCEAGCETGAGAFDGGENIFACEVSRVIDNVFSTIVMLRTPGGAEIRYECDKDAWASLGNPQQVSVRIKPEFVMPLVGERA